MGDKTGIEWTDTTWNCIRGCSRVSEGCRHCYAETTAGRFCGPGQPYEGLATRKLKVISDDEQRREARWTGEVRFVADHLADPLRWKKTRRIFVNSMSDLFHERLTNEQISAVFGVMAACPQHTFQILTKRARRMREWFEWAGECGSDGARSACRVAASSTIGRAVEPPSYGGAWPLPNVWLGVSVENHAAADERIPELLATPAAVRFLSCEPLLGSIRMREEWTMGRFIECPDENRGDEVDPCAGCPAIPNNGMSGGDYCGAIRSSRIDWVIAGCESGPGARPCEVDWLRSLRDQCAEAGVPYFLKQAKPQLGASTLITTKEQAESRVQGKLMGTIPIIGEGPGSTRKAGGIIGAPYLDGVQHKEFPNANR